MNPQETQAGIKEIFEIDITTPTIYNLVKWKCVPEPERGASRGGKWVDYHYGSIIWIAVSWRLIHGKYLARQLSEELRIIDGCKLDLTQFSLPKISPSIVAALHVQYAEKLLEQLRDSKYDYLKLKASMQNTWAYPVSDLLGPLQEYYCAAVDEALRDFAKCHTQGVADQEERMTKYFTELDRGIGLLAASLKR